MEGHGRSRKVKEGHGQSFPITGLTFQVRKVIGGGVGGCGGVVACRIIISPRYQSLSLTWDLDLGLTIRPQFYANLQ